MTVDLRQEHGRLVARLRRQVAKAQRAGATDEWAWKVRRTVHALIVTEKLMDMDELQSRAIRNSEERLDVLSGSVRSEDIGRRLLEMSPGAGLVIAGARPVIAR